MSSTNRYKFMNDVEKENKELNSVRTHNVIFELYSVYLIFVVNSEAEMLFSLLTAVCISVA